MARTKASEIGLRGRGELVVTDRGGFVSVLGPRARIVVGGWEGGRDDVARYFHQCGGVLEVELTRDGHEVVRAEFWGM